MIAFLFKLQDNLQGLFWNIIVKAFIFQSTFRDLFFIIY